MAVIKAGRSMGEVVFIDSQTSTEMDQVPSAVKEALNSQSGALPKVALSNAAGDKVYGTAAHDTLKGGLDKALKDARRAMREDKGGSTAPAESKTEAKAESSDSAAAGPAEIKVTDNKGVKDVTGAPFEQWTNTKGTAITAKVTKVTGTKVTLLTDKGKAITIAQADLAKESYDRLQEILGGN